MGGTAWLWARPEAAGAVDVLFVDEAGQMSLANVLAVSQAAKSLVLLGDPQQLEQPQKGSHPDGVDVSALEHMLGGHETMPADRGIFLAETWRLAPSDLRLHVGAVLRGHARRSRAGLERQRLAGAARFDGAGLCASSTVDARRQPERSDEEVDVVAGPRRASCSRRASTWIDADGVERTMTRDGHPRRRAVQRARRAARGTARAARRARRHRRQVPGAGGAGRHLLDGHVAPEDAPRGMEFLYSLNRLNVATSRAQCACILVASPRLFEPECRTPRQMQLANGLCRSQSCR